MRITPEQVVEAYKATGLKPMRGWYFQNKDCACGLGAIAANGGCSRNEDRADRWLVRNGGFHHSYIGGFAGGFDGEQSLVPGANAEEYKQGYADGQSAWNAVVDAGLVEVDS